MQPLESASNEELQQYLPEAIEQLLSEMRAEVPSVDWSALHGDVAERYRNRLVDSLTRLELTARMMRIVVSNAATDYAMAETLQDTAANLVLEVTFLNLKFRDTLHMLGEA